MYNLYIGTYINSILVYNILYIAFESECVLIAQTSRTDYNKTNLG